MPRHACAWLILGLLFWASGSSAQSLDIPAGQVLELSGTLRADTLNIYGTLKVSRSQASRLEIGCNLIVNPGGVLDMGTPADPVTVPHETVFHLSQVEARAFVGGGGFNETDCGLWNFGRWDAYGNPVLRTWERLTSTAEAGSTRLLVKGVTDWPVGGYVAISQTTDPHQWTVNKSGQTASVPVYEAEYRTIVAVDADGLTVTPALAFTHQVDGELRAAVGLLTRNITISTVLEGGGDYAGDVRTRLFAHTIFMPGSTGDLQHLAFVHMGHYGKLGRYAVHHHRMHDGSRKSLVRGASWFESGFRCTNIHESNGVLIEDTVCVAPQGVGHYAEIDVGVLQQADHAIVRNLVIGMLPVHRDDEDNSAVIGERAGRNAAGIWLGASEHEAHLGNLVAGPAQTTHAGRETTGYNWAELPTSNKGSMVRTFGANEAHALRLAGFFSWQNRSTSYDLFGSRLWRTNTGFRHGAYGFPLPVHTSIFAENRIAVQQAVKYTFLQDSIVRGRGLTATPVVEPDRGIVWNNGEFRPTPWQGSRFVRNVFRDLAPSTSGDLGTALSRTPIVCKTAADELSTRAASCAASYLRLALNTFGPSVRPFNFGSLPTRPFSPNVNTWWVDFDRARVLLRKDQMVPQGLFAPALITPATTYDAAADALATPFSSLPSSLTWMHIDDQDKPTPFTLVLQHDAPPTIALTVTRNGPIATMTATVSADTTSVEFWRNWMLQCVRTAPPWACDVPLDQDAVGDPLPPQKFSYLYARAFDGVTINEGPGNTAYEQRAYSQVFELGPDTVPDPPPPDPPPPPPPPDEQLIVLQQRVAALEAQVLSLSQQRDLALADAATRQAQLVQLQALVEQMQVQEATLWLMVDGLVAERDALTLARNALEVERDQAEAARVLLSQRIEAMRAAIAAAMTVLAGVP